MNKKKEGECLEVIKAALRRWDPIGVIDHSGEDTTADQEYDSYASGVLSLLESVADAKRIANHLAHIRTISIGLGNSNPSEREEELGEKLLYWKESDYKDVPDFKFTRYVF